MQASYQNYKDGSNEMDNKDELQYPKKDELQ